MWQAIRRSLGSLGRTDGRESRQAFWFYMLFIVIVRIVLAIAVSVPLAIASFAAASRAAREGVDPHALSARIMHDNSGWLHASVWVALVVGFVTILLVMAACVRRLHDSNRVGLWVLVPLVAYAISLAASFTIGSHLIDAMTMGGTDPATLKAARGTTPYGVFELIALISVIVFGVLPSTAGPNRFGARPTAD
jgi:uncharacterized membrane protein YhaH (DUF805 family)